MALTLIVEDGSGVTGANTYCSVAQADAYHDTVLRSEKWQTAEESDKRRALAYATRLLDEHIVWMGSRVVLTRETPAWPRYGMVDSEGVELSSSAIPQSLVDATAELARRLIEEDRVRKAEDVPVGLSSGSRSRSYASPRAIPVIPASIKAKFAHFAGQGRLMRVA